MSTESEVGAPHFRTEARKYRNANYTFEKVINEAIDNIIKKATEIHVKTTIDGDGRLQEVKISDNYVNGFENINLNNFLIMNFYPLFLFFIFGLIHFFANYQWIVPFIIFT